MQSSEHGQSLVDLASCYPLEKALCTAGTHSVYPSNIISCRTQQAGPKATSTKSDMSRSGMMLPRTVSEMVQAEMELCSYMKCRGSC